MKAIMVMYDSLCRNMLSSYGCDWIPTPNFQRLAERAVTFERNYVGSMPCIPARRELHTGRYNFLHRSWGPLEPYDDSAPQILKEHGIYTHLTTDHDHYWQDGGATYHSRYNTFHFSRGQEGDPWQHNSALLDFVTEKRPRTLENFYDKANREYLDCEEKMPQAVTFANGLEFIDKHHDHDSWFLQIETFDPHEPFFTQPEYKEAFSDDYDGPLTDWPPYYPVTEGPEAVRHMRNQYASLITMCDRYLGKVLDKMDEYNLWEDTMLIVNTDHGFLLGEHDWWAKANMPLYEEIAHTPLFIYDPVSKIQGERRDALTQTIDLPATLLDLFGLEQPKDMQGKSLLPVIREKKKVREYALFGFHEMHCCITDGDWVYMKSPLEGKEHYEYTLMPAHMEHMFTVQELTGDRTKLHEPFSFTKGCRLLQIPAQGTMNPAIHFGSKLFRLSEDPNQERPLRDDAKEAELANEMIRLMKETDAPLEYYDYLGFPSEPEVTAEMIAALRRAEFEDRIPEDRQVTVMQLFGLIPQVASGDTMNMLYYFGGMAARTE